MYMQDTEHVWHKGWGYWQCWWPTTAFSCSTLRTTSNAASCCRVAQGMLCFCVCMCAHNSSMSLKIKPVLDVTLVVGSLDPADWFYAWRYWSYAYVDPLRDLTSFFVFCSLYYVVRAPDCSEQDWFLDKFLSSLLLSAALFWYLHLSEFWMHHDYLIVDDDADWFLNCVRNLIIWNFHCLWWFKNGFFVH